VAVVAACPSPRRAGEGDRPARRGALVVAALAAEGEAYIGSAHRRGYYSLDRPLEPGRGHVRVGADGGLFRKEEAPVARRRRPAARSKRRGKTAGVRGLYNSSR
jgi:hypothetical protein